MMVEAMAGSGTPVVALDRGAVPELVRAGETGLVCGDPEDLPQALRDVTRLDPAACVAHVRNSFSAEMMAEGYERVYRSWASTARDRPADAALAPTGAW